MTTPKIIVCRNRDYMHYGRISHKAKCSMAPLNCPHEISEVITLKTGHKKQIYYCIFKPEEEKKTVKHEVHEMFPQKVSCRLDGT
jgi:hypothetical protein